MDPTIITHRIGYATTVNGTGVTGPEWTDVLERLTTVEGLADTINPFPPSLAGDNYISTISHGLGGTEGNGPMTTGSAYWVPFWLPEPMNCSAMYMSVALAATGAALMLGIYDATGTHRRTYGTIDASTTGAHILTITEPEPLAAGLNWACVLTNGVEVHVPRAINYRPMFYALATGTPLGAFRSPAAFGSLPATVSTSIADTIVPMISMRTT